MNAAETLKKTYSVMIGRTEYPGAVEWKFTRTGGNDLPDSFHSVVKAMKYYWGGD